MIDVFIRQSPFARPRGPSGPQPNLAVPSIFGSHDYIQIVIHRRLLSSTGKFIGLNVFVVGFMYLILAFPYATSKSLTYKLDFKTS